MKVIFISAILSVSALADVTYKCRFQKLTSTGLSTERNTTFIATPGSCAMSEEMTIDEVNASAQKCDEEIGLFIYSDKKMQNVFLSNGKKAKATVDSFSKRRAPVTYNVECAP